MSASRTWFQICLFVFGFAGISVYGEEVSWRSNFFTVDTREGIRVTTGAELIRWSSLWNGDENSTVSVSVNGVPVVLEQSGEGAFAWSEQQSGTYTFQRVTQRGGETVDVESVSFVKVDPRICVEAHPRYPWNGLVDIDCVVSGYSPGMKKLIHFERIDTITKKRDKLSSVTLNGLPIPNKSFLIGNGSHRFVWNAADDLGTGVVLSNVQFAVSLVQAEPQYCVIDLSGGKSATRYPVTYLQDVPAGGWTEEYKTTKLVMRRIPAGRFWMGKDLADLGWSSIEDYIWCYWYDCYEVPKHVVALTKDFWIGVFEVTQKQWNLVMGESNESDNDWMDFVADTHPVSTNYVAIRGEFEDYHKEDIHRVAEESFLGKLRSRVPELSFSLPTEAQWEYACRAGTTTAYYNGTDDNPYELGKLNSNDGIGEYVVNSVDGPIPINYPAIVGSYKPNAWGLYDMIGNYREWCVDHWGSIEYGVWSFVDDEEKQKLLDDPVYRWDIFDGSCSWTIEGWWELISTITIDPVAVGDILPVPLDRFEDRVVKGGSRRDARDCDITWRERVPGYDSSYWDRRKIGFRIVAPID